MFDCIRDGRFTRLWAGRRDTGFCGNDRRTIPLASVPAGDRSCVLWSVRDDRNPRARVAYLAAFAGMFGLLLLAVGRRLPLRGLWTPLLLTIVASGPLYFYATAEFGEMLAATALLGAVVAALYRRPWLLGITAMIASLGKETLPPFVLVLVIVVARDRSDGILPPARLTASAVVGTASGIAASVLFNMFRYGTPTNRYYLEPALRTVGSVRGSFFGAVFAAPNGGWHGFGLRHCCSSSPLARG